MSSDDDEEIHLSGSRSGRTPERLPASAVPAIVRKRVGRSVERSQPAKRARTGEAVSIVVAVSS